MRQTTKTLQSAIHVARAKHAVIDSADMNALHHAFHPVDWPAASETDAMRCDEIGASDAPPQFV